MSSDRFVFKQFTIRQDKCPGKISTDSVLLGAWANVKKAKTILDIGTVTGVIALMLAQRCYAKIDAIDICDKAIHQANENVQNSKWKDRITVIHTALQNYLPGKKYDLIVSNPPYFPCPETHRGKRGAYAKYTHLLSPQELLDFVIKHLSRKGGRFCMILPVLEGTCFTNEAEKRNLFLNTYTWVKTTAQKRLPKRILMEFSFRKTKLKENILTISDGNQYTPEYQNLTKAFYKHF